MAPASPALQAINTEMKASLLANLAFLGLFSLTQVSAQDAAAAVSANDNKDAAASATKQYIVSFEDEVTSEDFESVRKWIKEHNGEVVEAINENFAKLIIAKMDESISK